MINPVNSDYEVILFDLGGVLVELGEYPIPPEWLTGDSRFSLDEWFVSKTATAFERGEISAQEFARSLVQELNLNVTTTEVLSQFEAWPKGLFPGAVELLSRLRERYQLAALSNCNEIHWPLMQHKLQLEKHLDAMFSSHLINKTKPDTAAFNYVLHHLQTEAPKVLFFDDNAANIRSARELGMGTVLVNGISDIEMHLIGKGATQNR